MKKIFNCLLILICLLIMTSCETLDSSWRITNFFSFSVLEYGNIYDLPKPVDATNLQAMSADDIEFQTSKDGFLKYVSNIYEFLKSKKFQYIGTRGEVLSTFFGGAPTYAFYECDELSDFCEIRDDGLVNENIYRFVWSNSLTEYSELVDDCCITMKFVEDSETDVNAYMYITGSWVLTSYVYKEYKTLPMGYFSQWLRENPNIVEIRREISYALAIFCA